MKRTFRRGEVVGSIALNFMPRALREELRPHITEAGVKKETQKSRDAARIIAQRLFEEAVHGNYPQVNQFLEERNAKHIIIEGDQIHFIKISPRFSGKPFKPLVGRTRYPVPEFPSENDVPEHISLIGNIKFDKLPKTVQSRIEALKAMRETKKARVEIAKYTAVLTTLPVVVTQALSHQRPSLLLPVAISLAGSALVGTAAYLAGKNVGKISQKAVNQNQLVVREILRNRDSHQQISELIRGGATHVMVEKNGDVHFVQAPELFMDHTFKPRFKQTHAPLVEG